MNVVEFLRDDVLIKYHLVTAFAVVGATVVLEGGEMLELDSLRDWCRERLSVYKIPKRLLVVESLPRNAMGKVTKPAVGKLFAAED